MTMWRECADNVGGLDKCTNAGEIVITEDP